MGEDELTDRFTRAMSAAFKTHFSAMDALAKNAAEAAGKKASEDIERRVEQVNKECLVRAKAEIGKNQELFRAEMRCLRDNFFEKGTGKAWEKRDEVKKAISVGHGLYKFWWILLVPLAVVLVNAVSDIGHKDHAKANSSINRPSSR